MTAFSPRTNREYPSWSELVADEANGYSVVVLLEGRASSGNSHFVRVRGPFPDKKSANAAASTMRRSWKAKLTDPQAADAGTTLVRVLVEPLWKEL